MLLNGAARFFGTSEFALRYVSLLVGLLIIPCVYLLARGAANDRAGVYAALLVSLSAPLWWASQEARMYTLLALLVLLCALFWQRLVTRPSRALWLALAASELALLYAHNTGVVVALWLNLVTLLYWLIHRRPSWRAWLLGQAGVGALWLPYFITRFLLLGEANSAITAAPQVGLLLLGQVWLGFWVAPWALAVGAFSLLSVGAVVIAVFALPVLARVRWLALHVIILTSTLIVALIVLGNELHGRYLVMIVPLLLAALAVGLARLRWHGLHYVVLSFCALLAVSAWLTARDPLYQHDDARAMVQFYADHLTAEDSVISWSYADRYELAYYWDRLGVQARRITLPEGADLEAVLPLLPDSGDVALNVWYTQRADYRGMMSCILASGTLNAPETFTTYGMSTLIYHNPLLDLPALQPLDLTFSDAQMNPVAQVSAAGAAPALTAERALCLPLQARLLRGVDADLKAALIVQNQLGWTVARADAIFATANQRTSAALAPGESLMAYPLLRLPYGAPAGEYRIFLRLYDETAAPSGYSPVQTGQTLVGRDLLLALWDVLPGADWMQVQPPTFPPLHTLNLPPLGDLALLADSFSGEAEQVVTNGEEIRLSLLWQGRGALPLLELVDEAGKWRVAAPPLPGEASGIRLDWRAIRVPPDAESGTASLRFTDGTVMARFRVSASPLLTEAPPYAHALGVRFPGVGELVGYTANEAPYSAENPPSLTLIWRAGEQTPALNYTVTAQLVDAAGQVIAQSDAVPGERPTTGWRAGEYIEDRHTLAFNGVAAAGEARLIVALYDALTGERVMLADGADAALLAEDVAVHQ